MAGKIIDSKCRRCHYKKEVVPESLLQGHFWNINIWRGLCKVCYDEQIKRDKEIAEFQARIAEENKIKCPNCGHDVTDLLDDY